MSRQVEIVDEQVLVGGHVLLVFAGAGANGDEQWQVIDVDGEIVRVVDHGGAEDLVRRRASITTDRACAVVALAFRSWRYHAGSAEALRWAGRRRRATATSPGPAPRVVGPPPAPPPGLRPMDFRPWGRVEATSAGVVSMIEL